MSADRGGESIDVARDLRSDVTKLREEARRPGAFRDLVLEGVNDQPVSADPEGAGFPIDCREEGRWNVDARRHDYIVTILR